jgi:hypothetical protein
MTNRLSLTAFLIMFATILLLTQPAVSWKAVRTFRFKNSSPKTIWIGGFGVPLMPQTGWEMAAYS